MATVIQLKKLGAAGYTNVEIQKFFKSLGNFGRDGNYLKIDNSNYDVRQVSVSGAAGTEEISLLVDDINGVQKACTADDVMLAIKREGYNGIMKIEPVGNPTFYAKTSTFSVDQQIHN